MSLQCEHLLTLSAAHSSLILLRCRDAVYACMAEASRFEAWCTALVVARVLPSIFKLALAEEPERAALGLTVAARPLRKAVTFPQQPHRHALKRLPEFGSGNRVKVGSPVATVSLCVSMFPIAANSSSRADLRAGV